MSRVFDGTADAAERRLLADRLAADPALRRAWWAEVAWRSHLREELTALRGEESGRRLVARRRAAPVRRRPTFRLLLPLAAAAAVVLAVTGWLLTSAPSAPPAPAVVSLAGSFTGSGELRLADGSLLRFAQADYRVEDVEGSRITLRSGQVAAEVAPRDAGRPLVIATPHGETVVVGTRFTLAVDAGATLLQVMEGSVRFAGRPVAAGEALLAGAWGVAARTVVIAPESGPTLAEACRRLGPGEAVILAAGEHTRGGDADALAQVIASASATQPARIRNAPGARPILRGRGWDVMRASGQHLEISGLDFAGTAGGEGNGLVLAQGAGLHIADCRFTGFGGDGLNAHGIDGLVIEDCAASGNGGRSAFGQGGISIFRGPGAADTILRRLRLAGNRTGSINQATGTPTGGHGLWLGRDAGKRPGGVVRVEACVISGNQGPGLALVDSGVVEVRDCRFIGNGSGPVGELRAQLTASGDSQLDLAGTVLASDPGAALLRLWPPAAVLRSGDNRVWGGGPPGPGFTPLSAAPSP